MHANILAYGNAGWSRKLRMVEEILAARPAPPCMYSDVLILVHSSRMRRVYSKLFLDAVERLYGRTALVQPEIHTLHQFLQRLSEKAGVPPLIDENSRLIMLEGIVKEQLSAGFPFRLGPDLLAPSLSSALAQMIEQLSGAGIGCADLTRRIEGSEFSGRPQVDLLIAVYGLYEQRLREAGLVDPAGMRASLLERFDPAWFGRFRTIIIDGIQEVVATEAEILKRIAAGAEGTYLLEAPSADMAKHAPEGHPLKIVRDILEKTGLLPQDAAPAADADQLFLAEALFSDRSFAESAASAPDPASFGKTMNALSAINMREEVSFIAAEVKKSLRKRTPADSILVAFPSLDAYGPLVEELFTDYGIPYNRALGRQLSSSAVATAVVSLLRACQEDFSGPSLLRIIGSPFLKFSADRSLSPALDRLLRRQRIIGGRKKILAALNRRAGEPEADLLAGPVDDLFAALEPFTGKEALPLGSWMKQLDAVLTWSELGDRVTGIHGPLNINLQAYKKITETLDSLARAGRLFPGYVYTFHEWFFLLKKTFMHTRFQVPPDDEGGVQILGLEESQGLPWREIYLGGLVDGKFPQRLPQNIFLPERTLEAMGVRTLERARLGAAHHFYRLLLSADKVTLTWPENEGDRPAVESPFLEELTPLRKAGLVNRGLEITSGIQFALKVEESRSIPELAKAVCRVEDFSVPELLGKLDVPGLSGIRSALGAVAGPGTVFAPHDRRIFSVTELNAYLNCPYDYYVTKVLGLEPLEEVTEDISPLDRGSKVHAILRDFYLSWNRPVTRQDRKEASALLRTLAEAAFAREADTFRNRRERDFFLTVMAERFLDAEELFWKQGMRPAYLEQKIESFPLLLSSGERVELSAKIDRIDVDDKGDFIIVDYKTGKYPLPKMTVEQDIFQLPLYAVMATAPGALSARGPTLRKAVGLAYYDLSGKTGGGARDVVLYSKDARDDHPSSKPKASVKSGEEFETILKQSTDKARRAVESILAGNFSSRPREESACRFCQNEMMCEREQQRD